jgi:hypothetical protein
MRSGNAAACKPKKIEYLGSETNVVWSADSKQIAFVGRPGSAHQLAFAARVCRRRQGDRHPRHVEIRAGPDRVVQDGKIRMTTTTGRKLRALADRSEHETNLRDSRRTPAG